MTKIGDVPSQLTFHLESHPGNREGAGHTFHQGVGPMELDHILAAGLSIISDVLLNLKTNLIMELVHILRNNMP